MTRVHPGVALAVGMAWADLLTGPTTYEVRLFDPAAQQDQGVIGRVTLIPGAPRLLPAPGAPVVVPDSTVKGDLNVKLRWAAPDALRRLGLLHYGYTVWRVTRTCAEASTNRWHVTPPGPDLLLSRSLALPNHVKRCNELPILTDKDFRPTEARNFGPPPAGDPDTFFFSDDDGRFRPGYVNPGFTNGAQFYYFVTARDILGRDGLVSPGTLLTVCDRNPPPPPERLQVFNDYAWIGGTLRQALRLVWNQNTNLDDGVTHYWVYRWTNLNELHARAGTPTNNRIAIVPHSPGATAAGYLDAGAGAPSAPADLGRTFWYTVRAQDSGVCGPNLSGNSAPAFGVLRDREGPPAPDGAIEIFCVRPYVRFRNFELVNPEDAGRFTFRLNCHRGNRQISHVRLEAWITDTTSGRIVGVYSSGWLFYAPHQEVCQFRFTADHRYFGNLLQIRVNAVTAAGEQPWLVAPVAVRIEESWLPYDVAFNFEAGLDGQRVRASETCGRHHPVTPQGLKTNIFIPVFPSPGSREWRLYRRVDDGPLTLLCHGPVVGGISPECQDDGAPPNGATICYYLQTLDEHGNPSPMVKLGCVQTAPHAPPPAPLLSPLVATGVTNNPGMTITWFCPPPGLERFEVWIATKPGALSTNLAPGFLALREPTDSQPDPAPMTLVLQGLTNTWNFHVFLTPRIGPGFGPGP